jgi:hypothetical protein
MKNWWRKWTYEVPLAFSDALWAVCVVQFADFLSRLTIRKVLEFFVIAMLAMAFAQTFPIDLAILFAGDTLMYLEILVALRLAAGRGALRAMWLFATRLAGAALRVMTFAISRSFATIRQSRQRPVHRQTPRGKPTASDDEPAIAWGVLSFA